MLNRKYKSPYDSRSPFETCFWKIERNFVFPSLPTTAYIHVPKKKSMKLDLRGKFSPDTKLCRIWIESSPMDGNIWRCDLPL